MKTSLAQQIMNVNVAIALRQDVKNSEGTATFVKLFNKYVVKTNVNCRLFC